MPSWKARWNAWGRVRIRAQLIDARRSAPLGSELRPRRERRAATGGRTGPQYCATDRPFRPGAKRRTGESAPGSTDGPRRLLRGRYYWNKRTKQVCARGSNTSRRQSIRTRTTRWRMPAWPILTSCSPTGVLRHRRRPTRRPRRQLGRRWNWTSSLRGFIPRWRMSPCCTSGIGQQPKKDSARPSHSNPNYASAHPLLQHFYLVTSGRHAEALVEIKRAQELIPCR